MVLQLALPPVRRTPEAGGCGLKGRWPPSHPLSTRSRSTSRSRRRRAIATIRPSPTTTSDAATAITASAKTWPVWSPCMRANEIRARLAALSMISSESRTISGLRRRSTPAVPIEKSRAATIRYQETSGPCTRRLRLVQLVLRPRARAEHHAADRRHEQHDRRDLERQQVVGEEEAADLLRAAERALDLRGLGKLVVRSQADHHHDLDEQRRRRDDGPDPHPVRAAGEPHPFAAIAQVGEHEEDRERAEVRDQRQGGVEGVREGDHGKAGAEAAGGSQEPDRPDEEVAH